MAKRFWQGVLVYWQIIVAAIPLLGGAAAWAYNAYDARISKVEHRTWKQERTMTRMDYNIQLIAKSVHVDPLLPPKDEDGGGE